MIEDEGKYYLYSHIRSDTNVPFYVGIGKKINNFKKLETEYYRAYNKKLRNKFWKDIVEKTSYSIKILLESNNNSFIKEKEKEFIKLYGRIDCKKGSLCNLTDGGDGCNDFKPNSEQLLKMKICQNKNKVPVLCLNLNGKVHKKYNGLTDAAKELNLMRANIRKLCKTYKNSEKEINHRLKEFIFCYELDYNIEKYYKKSTKVKDHCLRMSKLIAERKKLNKQKIK